MDKALDGGAFAGLARWLADGAVPEAMLAEVMAHPRFAEAVRTFAANMLDIISRDAALDGICKDAGRYVAAMWSLYLHVSGELTLPRLKEMCISSGMLSPGRARSLLLYFRHLGYIEALPKAARGEPTRYAPTAEFITAWRDHLRGALEAAALIEPAVAPVLERLKEPRIFDSVVRTQGEDWLSSAQQSTRETPFMRVVMHRHAGNQIIWTLIVSSEGGAFPPEKTVPISTAQMARRFHVSRPHIKRLFDSAAQEGLMQQREDGVVVFDESMQTTLKYLYATHLARLLIAAAKTMAAYPASAADNRGALALEEQT